MSRETRKYDKLFFHCQTLTLDYRILRVWIGTELFSTWKYFRFCSIILENNDVLIQELRTSNKLRTQGGMRNGEISVSYFYNLEISMEKGK